MRAPPQALENPVIRARSPEPPAPSTQPAWRSSCKTSSRCRSRLAVKVWSNWTYSACTCTNTACTGKELCQPHGWEHPFPCSYRCVRHQKRTEGDINSEAFNKSPLMLPRKAAAVINPSGRPGPLRSTKEPSSIFTGLLSANHIKASVNTAANSSSFPSRSSQPLIRLPVCMLPSEQRDRTQRRGQQRHGGQRLRLYCRLFTELFFRLSLRGWLVVALWDKDVPESDE